MTPLHFNWNVVLRLWIKSTFATTDIKSYILDQFLKQKQTVNSYRVNNKIWSQENVPWFEEVNFFFWNSPAKTNIVIFN